MLTPNELIESLEARSHVQETACGKGTMPWRIWDQDCRDDAETIVLLHGGSGSWLHWVRNIDVLAQRCRVIAPDLPGLGDATGLRRPYSVDDAVAPVESGMKELLGPTQPFRLTAFSWGSCVASQLARRMNDRLIRLTLLGPASLGRFTDGQTLALVKRRPRMSAAEIEHANRQNLHALMISDAAKIDDLAMEIQGRNVARARFNSPQFAREPLTRDALCETQCPLTVLFGEYDATTMPDLQARLDVIAGVRDDAQCEVIPDAGHWVQFEAAEVVNQRLLADLPDPGQHG